MKSLEIKDIELRFGKDNVSVVADNLCRCENRDEDLNIYQIIYIHLTNDWINSDYQDFIERNIIEDYYKNEGYLQWNFYYYIISDENVIKSNLTLKKAIENDDIYCRKLVLTPKELINLFNSYDDISKDTNEINVDLYSLWVNKLREEELFFVFDDAKYPNYKKPVDDYLEGKPFKDSEKADKSSSIEESKINRLNQLNLIEFREFPITREHLLGSVNLIFGPNAVGKTSFFDAIELSLTGGVNSKEISANYKLTLTDINDYKYEYPPKKNDIYKNRDNSWYSSGLNRGNRLNANFNKFNYFSSDAAFLLKKEEDDNKSDNLERVMSDIALGRDVNKLEERIKAFKDKFEDKLKEFKKDKNSLQDDLKEKENLLAEFDNRDKAFIQYKTLLANSLSTNNWKGVYDFQKDELIVELDSDLQSVQNYIIQIKNKNHLNLKSLSSKYISDEVSNLKASLREVLELEESVNEFKNIKTKCISLQQRFNLLLENIEELKRYFSHEHFENLLTIDDQIKNKELEINENQGTVILFESTFRNTEFILEFDNNKTLFDIEKELLENKEYNLQKESEFNNQISQFEKNIEELSVIISNIKSSGKTFIIKNPNASSCPLCNTSFEHSDLEKAILNTKNSFANSEILISYKNNLQTTKNTLKKIEENLLVLNSLKKLYFIMFNDGSFKKTINAVRIEGRKIVELNPILKNELFKFNTIKESLSNQKLDASNYKEIINSIKTYASDQIRNNDQLSKFKTKVENDIKKNNGELVLADININSLEVKLLNHNIFKLYSNTNDIAKSINNLLDIEFGLKEIEKFINIKSSATILDISEYVNNILSAFNNYQKAFLLIKEVNAKDAITTEIAEINIELSEIKKREKKGNHAAKILNSLLNENGKDVFLNNYILTNKNEITSIFKMIHSPKEFIDLDFKDGKINLTDNNRNIRGLGEISTGQRSALALSIFLSLNKKLKNGPNIIMFDDPVTYIDDLNVLTFFDYLREVVLKTKRQVFFATANEDLAFLFEKKFEFLKNDFIKHKLDRSLN